MHLQQLDRDAVRPCVSANRPDVVIPLLQGKKTINQERCSNGDAERSVVSVDCAVSICEVDDEREQM